MKTFTLVAVLLASVPAAAQSAGDARWAPWAGCWDLVTDAARDASLSPGTIPGGPGPRRPQAESRPRVCVTPTAGGGATFQTSVPGQDASEQIVEPSASERPVTDQDCRGTQRSEWSADGLRLFARASVTCSGDEAPRTVSGITLLAPDGTWVDIQSVLVASRESVRVRRYRRQAGDAGGQRPSSVVGTRLTLEDVQEASAKVTPRALEAALVETSAGFDLKGRDLVALDEAGVADSVIDLIVALSYPERFVVERTRADAGPVPLMYGSSAAGSVFDSPLWWDDFGFYSSAFGYYSPFYYSPFGYSYSNRYDPRFLNGGFFPVADGGGGGTASPQPSGAGRVVDGQGYTRVRPREAATAEATRQTGGGSTESTASGGGSSSTSSGSSSSSGGGSVSPQGASSGGASSDSGRTAQPR